MMISIRLDPKTKRAFDKLARFTGKSRSMVIRQAIRQLSEQAEQTEGHTAYDRMAESIGIVNLGPGKRAARSEEILREIFASRQAHR